MKRLVISFVALICGMMAWADTIVPAEMGIRYYLPRTVVKLVVEYTETQYIPGKYAAWAKKLLGVDQAIQEDSTAYQMDDVHLVINAVPDTARAYYVHPQTGIQTQWLSLTKDGILYGYNESYNAPTPHKRRNRRDTIAMTTILPASTLEETIKSDSLALQAKSIAKQIYQLRDNRIYLLSGDAENTPADGISMKAILEEIDRQEQALVQLFMGKQLSRKVHREFMVDPTLTLDSAAVLCIGEDTLRISIVPETMTEAQPVVDKKAKKQKGAPTPSEIYYNIPGMAHITLISDKYGELLQEYQPVAQLGVSVPLPQELFSNAAERVKIRFDVNTGNILSIRRQ